MTKSGWTIQYDYIKVRLEIIQKSAHRIRFKKHGGRGEGWSTG